MKKLEIIIKSEKLDLLKDVLERFGVTGLMMTNVLGYGNETGYTQVYRGEKFKVNLLPKIKVETVVKDSICDELVNSIIDNISTGSVGDGKIFIYNVDDAVRIRTGERGYDAV